MNLRVLAAVAVVAASAGVVGVVVGDESIGAGEQCPPRSVPIEVWRQPLIESGQRRPC